MCAWKAKGRRFFQLKRPLWNSRNDLLHVLFQNHIDNQFLFDTLIPLNLYTGPGSLMGTDRSVGFLIKVAMPPSVL